MIEKVFFHVDLDAFFASVEQLDNPEYRGKPLIVGGKPSDRRSVVSTCSYEARKYGVHSAMPTYKAYELCPNAIFVYGRMHRYSEKSEQVMSIFNDFSPDVQQMSIDEAFLDMTGTTKLFGEPREAAMLLKKTVKEKTGLTVSVGCASNKYLAKIASGLQKPDGLTIVPFGQEEEFMLSLPVGKIWGAGTKTQEHLKRSGFLTNKDIHKTSIKLLKSIFGEFCGEFLYYAVRGEEVEKFSPVSKSHSMSFERTFEFDLTDTYIIESVLMELSQELMFRLLREEWNSKTVHIKLRYEDFSTVNIQTTGQRVLSTSDAIFETAKALFYKKYESGRGVRLLGVGLQNLEKGIEDSQGQLFDFGEHKKQAIEKTVLDLQKKLPDIKIKKARLIKKSY